MNSPVIAGLDLSNGKDMSVVVVMQGTTCVATFKGKDAVLKAAAWARLRNLKMNLVMDKQDLERLKHDKTHPQLSKL